MTDAEKIAELTAQVEGMKLAAAMHEKTRLVQADIIARANGSQPILSAVVASELPAMIMDMACNSFHGSPSHEMRCAYADGYRRAKADAANLVAAALASAPAQPVAAIPEAGPSVLTDAEIDELWRMASIFGGDTTQEFVRYFARDIARLCYLRHLVATMSADAQSKGGE